MIEVLEKFRNFAHYEKIAVILLSQLPRSATTTRGKNNPKPTLHDLKESGNIENDAENVLMMWQPIRYNIKKVEIDGQDYPTLSDLGGWKLAEIIVAKQRHGKSGWSCPLWFDGNITSFYGYENRYGEQCRIKDIA